MRKTIRNLKRKLKKIILPCILAGILVLFYGCWEAKQLECNYIDIPETNLPGCDGLKIALISDIHGRTDLLEKAVTMIDEAKPDITVITGDFYTASQRSSRTHKMVEALQKIRAICPVYACLGNHDMEKLDIITRVLAHADITLLRNERTVYHCSRLNRSIVLAGVGEALEYDFFPDKCLNRKGENQQFPPTLLLCHNPLSREKLKHYQWNLMLCGHTHGYQACYPFTQKSVLYRHGDTYSQGYLDFDGTGIFLTRGIGSYFGLRFFCPPEINILTIKK